jgi:hypothetical protein
MELDRGNTSTPSDLSSDGLLVGERAEMGALRLRYWICRLPYRSSTFETSSRRLITQQALRMSVCLCCMKEKWGLERRPVTPGVAGSSPVRSAKLSFQISRLRSPELIRDSGVASLARPPGGSVGAGVAISVLTERALHDQVVRGHAVVGSSPAEDADGIAAGGLPTLRALRKSSWSRVAC